jgi:hypothetical protein
VVISFACCFIHRDVQIEILVCIYQIACKLKLNKLCPCFKCFNVENISELRRRTRGLSTTNPSLNSKRTSGVSLNSSCKSRKQSTASSSKSFEKRLFPCLFAHDKNDFYEIQQARRSLLNNHDLSPTDQSKSGSFLSKLFPHKSTSKNKDLIKNDSTLTKENSVEKRLKSELDNENETDQNNFIQIDSVGDAPKRTKKISFSIGD